MLRVIPTLAALGLLASCGVNPGEARRALEAQGMTHVKILGYAPFGCGRDDEFKSYFEAIGANGRKVTGVVCSGFLKGVTVRFD